MSEENVERLRWLYGEWAKGNLWALREIADPNIEWEWSPKLASLSGASRMCNGLDEVEADTREWLNAWDRYWMTAEDFIEANGEVVVFMRLHARAAGSESVIEQRVAAVWSLRDERAVRVRYYDDRDEALKAAGLSE